MKTHLGLLLFLVAGCGDNSVTPMVDAGVSADLLEPADLSTGFPRLLFKSDIATWGKSGPPEFRDDYDWAVDPSVTYNGESTWRLSSLPLTDGGVSTPGEWTTSVAPFKGAKAYLGKRIRVSALLKTAGLTGLGTALWLRLDDTTTTSLELSNGINPTDRRIKKDQDFTRYEVVLDVPPETLRFAFGLFLFDGGQVWIADAKVEEVGTDVPESAWVN